MPIYEYACAARGKKFGKLVRQSLPAPDCAPNTRNIRGRLRVAGSALIRVDHSGWASNSRTPHHATVRPEGMPLSGSPGKLTAVRSAK